MADESPDVWIAFDAVGPLGVAREKQDGPLSWRLYIPHAAAQEQVERLREALRAAWIRDAGAHKHGPFVCRCGFNWNGDQPERHAPCCLAAKDRP